MTKTELAQMYMPDVSPETARRQLNRWIRKNKELQRELTAAGWDIKNLILTPIQVRIIEKYVGEPD